jgi:hypothetical protein
MAGGGSGVGGGDAMFGLGVSTGVTLTLYWGRQVVQADNQTLTNSTKTKNIRTPMKEVRMSRLS